MPDLVTFAVTPPAGVMRAGSPVELLTYRPAPGGWAKTWLPAVCVQTPEGADVGVIIERPDGTRMVALRSQVRMRQP